MQNAKELADKFLKDPKDPEIKRMAKELLGNEHANDWLQERSPFWSSAEIACL